MIILESLFFALPIYIANSGATLSMSIPIIKKFRLPIDLGHKIKGKRIFGDGKTFSGIFVGILFSLIVGLLQHLLSNNIDFIFISKNLYTKLSTSLVTSFLLGFGALLGDLVKSFFKRRIGIERGKPWPLFDQLDFLVGSILICSIVYIPSIKIIIILFILTPIGHLLSNIAAYKLKLKKVWW